MLKDNCTYQRLIFTTILVAIFSAGLVGCHSYGHRVGSAINSFYVNDIDRAATEIQTQREKRSNRKNEDLLKLEESTMRMCRGEFVESESLLREVRDSLDGAENERLQNASAKMTAMLSDDCALRYAGEDYEKVMIRAMLAMGSLMRDGSDARAYSNQIELKQQEIIDRSDVNPETNEKIKKSYSHVALGPFLSGVIEEESMMNPQEVARSLTQVSQWNPSFQLGQDMLRRAQSGVPSQKGNGVVYVFLMLGRGPFKVQDDAPVTQLSLLVADQIVSATSKHSVPPTLAPVPIPKVVESPCRYGCAKVLLDGQHMTQTETITDVNRMAAEQFEINRPWIIARAVARRVVKKAGIYGLKEAAGTNSGGGELLLDLVGVVWEATEEADTRCWTSLPGRIQVARIEVPAGEHEIQLEPVTGGYSPRGSYFQEPGIRVETGVSVHVAMKPMTSSVSRYKKTVRVSDGRNTYVFAYIADEGLLGEIQVSP